MLENTLIMCYKFPSSSPSSLEDLGRILPSQSPHKVFKSSDVRRAHKSPSTKITPEKTETWKSCQNYYIFCLHQEFIAMCRHSCLLPRHVPRHIVLALLRKTCNKYALGVFQLACGILGEDPCHP